MAIVHVTTTVKVMVPAKLPRGEAIGLVTPPRARQRGAIVHDITAKVVISKGKAVIVHAIIEKAATSLAKAATSLAKVATSLAKVATNREREVISNVKAAINPALVITAKTAPTKPPRGEATGLVTPPRGRKRGASVPAPLATTLMPSTA